MSLRQKQDTNPYLTGVQNREHSYQEIADHLGTSIKQVKSLEQSALRKLKNPMLSKKVKENMYSSGVPDDLV